MAAGRKGQIALYAVLVMLAVVALALMNADLFLFVRNKNRLQNAGDAAALAAAKVQLECLERIGELNIRHMEALVRGDRAECDRIVMEQRRTALLGPVRGLRAASDAAEKNGAARRDEYLALFNDHIDRVLSIYAGGDLSGDPYPEPYEGAWKEYAEAISAAIEGGLAAAPDNVEMYGAGKGHMLLDKRFYFAVSGREWCWFHFNAMDLLESYSSFEDWAPLPSREEKRCDNSEIFSLHLKPVETSLGSVLSKSEIREIIRKFFKIEISADEESDAVALLLSSRETWFFFDMSGWGTWFNGDVLAGEEESGTLFPLVGEIKEEYNVKGAAAVMRCDSSPESVLFPREEKRSTWCAAAKPFGRLDMPGGLSGRVTACSALVLPSFDAVRLVPVDAVDGSRLCTADIVWVEHVRRHLDEYLLSGPKPGTGCMYCEQLFTWENEAFRKSGIEWLRFNSGSCRRPLPGGGGSGGGASHGH
ncbi:MAG: hypothetical protein IKD42_00350 [Kiritimatiellae bacterium]|nr:hypothetical protein [Kiritimatiellia bacterium]